MSKVVIFGAGSFAQVVHFYLTHDSDHEVVAFTTNESHFREKHFLGLPIIEFERIEKVFPPDAFNMYIAVGYKKLNQVRSSIYNEAKSKGYKMISYLSSKCTHWNDTKVGENCFIFEDNTIQPFVTIGDNVIIWSGNHIGHHATIGDHCFITSHVVISGHVHIGPYSFVGVNATIRDDIHIGESCVIGAGSLILKSTKNGDVYAAKRTERMSLKSHELGM